MRTLLIDAYTHENAIVLWLKNHENEDFRMSVPFSVEIYMECTPDAQHYLEKKGWPLWTTRKKTYLGEWKTVYVIRIPKLSQFNRFVRTIEQETHHRIALYNADVKPEMTFLAHYGLKSFSPIEIEEGKIKGLEPGEKPVLTEMFIEASCKGDPLKSFDAQLNELILDDVHVRGSERELLQQLVQAMEKKNPDIIRMHQAYLYIPYFAKRMEQYGIPIPFHRFDPTPLRYHGGRSFGCYGQVIYRDFSIQLHGRFLIDTATAVGGPCSVDAILELCELSGGRFAHVAGRSFGAAFQSALTRMMVQEGFLVPFKEKPVDQPITLFDLTRGDRVGHTFDPKLGFHTDVAEIDFASMYPWIIYNYNISVETIHGSGHTYLDVPGLPLRISLDRKGLVPRALLPFLQRRMHYKENPSTVNRDKVQGLKGVLVSCYGYLRFREFTLGIATSHMAIGAFAREILLSIARLAESHGFEIIHGIVDSMYIRKPGMTEADVRKFCGEVKALTGIPISYEGMFKWIVFLSGINDPARPLPARYYGVFMNGEVKARGVEVRQRSSPVVVKTFQQTVLEMMARCQSKEEIVRKIPKYISELRTCVQSLEECSSQELAIKKILGKVKYRVKNSQAKTVERLTLNDHKVYPGQWVNYVHTRGGNVRLSSEYTQGVDVHEYRALLVRSLYILLQPFGVSKTFIEERVADERQCGLGEFKNGEFLNRFSLKRPKDGESGTQGMDSESTQKRAF